MSWLNSVQRTRYFFQKSRITRHDHNLLSHLLHTSTQGNTTIQTSLSVTALYTDIRCKLQTKCSACWATGWGRECVLLEQVLVYVLKASKQTHVHVNGDSGSVQDLHLASKHLRHAVSGRSESSDRENKRCFDFGSLGMHNYVTQATPLPA